MATVQLQACFKVVALLLPFVSLAIPTGGRPPAGGVDAHQTACNGKSAGDACTVTVPGKPTLTTTCSTNPEDKLRCGNSSMDPRSKKAGKDSSSSSTKGLVVIIVAAIVVFFAATVFAFYCLCCRENPTTAIPMAEFATAPIGSPVGVVPGTTPGAPHLDKFSHSSLPGQPMSPASTTQSPDFDFAVLREPLDEAAVSTAVKELNLTGFYTEQVTAQDVDAAIKVCFVAIAKPYRLADPELVRLASLEVGLPSGHFATAAADGAALEWDYFLSHHKAGAGLGPVIVKADLHAAWRKAGHQRDPRVFLDVDDLNDLRKLLDAVRSTRNFVFMLTRDILSRPWCLAELFVAIRSANTIVVPLQLRAYDVP